MSRAEPYFSWAMVSLQLQSCSNNAGFQDWPLAASAHLCVLRLVARMFRQATRQHTNHFLGCAPAQFSEGGV